VGGDADAASLAPCMRGLVMRTITCHDERMIRALHGRWPYRRSHSRHDFHWLARVRAPQRCGRAGGRTHAVPGLPAPSRRGEGG
jgi:hypothetical protein